MRTTLLCTVGTSLFDANLKKLNENMPNLPDNWQGIKQAFEKKQWQQLAQELLKIDATARLCGAEINTIQELRGKSGLRLEQIIFLVSDTEDGRNTGKLLKSYFERREDLPLRKGGVDFEVIEKLQDAVPKDFKIHGLRNLVRKIGNIIRKTGGPENVAIDATGGYKAQIAIALLIGQALNIPVYYKHERFNEIIDFPPMPVSLDYELFAKNAHLLIALEKGEALTLDELGEEAPRLRVLLSEVDVNGEQLFALSPIGEIYLTGYRIRYPKPISLRPAIERKSPTFAGDHHLPIGFKEFAEKVWRETEWIVSLRTLPYYKQKSIKDIQFFVREEEDRLRLVGAFADKDNFGARFLLRLTDESLPALTWAADFLNRKYQ